MSVYPRLAAVAFIESHQHMFCRCDVQRAIAKTCSGVSWEQAYATAGKVLQRMRKAGRIRQIRYGWWRRT